MALPLTILGKHRIESRLQKLLRIGMFGCGKYPFRRSGLHNLAVFHHRNLVAEIPHNRHIMADEQIAQIVPGLEIFQQLNHLELNGPVQGRGGLVQDDEPGFEHKSPGQGDALPLSAGELVRVSSFEVRIQSHFHHRFVDEAPPILFLTDIVDLQALADDAFHRHPGLKEP
jgi:hypothetical protein